jgi:hypothetical protein
MEKGQEFLDSWVKSQKEFLETWLKSQKEFLANWTESMKKLEESFVNFGASQEGPGKEIGSFYSAILSNMTKSAKAFSDEALKMQETWKINVEKQIDMGREMVNNFSNLFEQAAKKN